MKDPLDDYLLKADEQRKRLLGSSSNVLDFPKNYLYVNGNYYVSRTNDFSTCILEKTLFCSDSEDFISAFPDSIDLKITNRCSWGCPFCHESSMPDGKSFDLERTKKILSDLPKVPIEIAIGGGNVLECPDTIPLLSWIVCNTPFLPRVTINQKDFIKYRKSKKTSKFYNTFQDMCYLIGGLGVSLQNIPTYDITEKTRENILEGFLSETSFNWKENFPIIHIIAGVFSEDNLKTLLESHFPILVLGYKQFGRAKNTLLPDLSGTENIIKDYIRKGMKQIRTGPILSFDNLAIEQLHLKEVLSSNEWNSLYMGGEGKHSMYIDAVEETFAKTSRSEKRVSWNEMNIVDFFNLQKNDTVNF